MGNIAAAPSGVTQFYHALFTGRIVSEGSLAQMMDWKPLTVGFEPGTPYGLGLMKNELQVRERAWTPLRITYMWALGQLVRELECMRDRIRPQ